MTRDSSAVNYYIIPDSSVTMQPTKQKIAQLPRLEIPSQPARDFPHFPELPAEIRHKIWGYAAFKPRTIKLFTDTWKWIPAWHPSHQVEGQFHVPALLHVNQEARREGQRYYEKCYERTPWHNTMTIPIDEGQDFDKGNPIFINYEVDVFLHEPRPAGAEFQGMDLRLENYNFDTDVLSRIRHILVPYKFSATSSELSPDVYKVTSLVEVLLKRVLNHDLHHLTITVLFDYHDETSLVWTLDCVDGHLGSKSYEESFLKECTRWRWFKGVKLNARWFYDEAQVTDLPACSAETRLSEFYHPSLGVFGFRRLF